MIKLDLYLECKDEKRKGLVAQSCLTFHEPMTATHQVPLLMGFSRQEYWSGLLFPSPRELVTQRWNPGLPHCRQILYHLSH